MLTGNSASKTLNAGGCQIYIDLNRNLYFVSLMKLCITEIYASESGPGMKWIFRVKQLSYLFPTSSLQ